jgi:UDP:flavonoid glycosyltransferase YjiC (YdhE family)
MKIVLVTVGSRGDVQPMLALSLALKARGHAVLLAGPPEREAWAKGLGCPYAALGGDIMAFVDGGRSTWSPAAALAFRRFLREEVRAQFRALPGLVAGADLVVGASLSFGLSSVAEALKIPYRYIAFTPQLLPSGHHPCPRYPHGALFPRMAAVIHHGGAGTTATAAAGGTPQIIIPHILDQYFWGERVRRAGIGLGLPGRRRQKAEILSGIIHDCVCNTRIKQNAGAVRDAIREKDGVGLTVKELLS